MSILRCEALAKTYVSGGREITVLRDITVSYTHLRAHETNDLISYAVFCV